MVFRSPGTNEPWFDYDAITSEFEKFFKEHNIDPSSVPVGFNEGNAPVSEKIGDVDLNGTIDVTDLTDISLADRSFGITCSKACTLML